METRSQQETERHVHKREHRGGGAVVSLTLSFSHSSFACTFKRPFLSGPYLHAKLFAHPSPRPLRHLPSARLTFAFAPSLPKQPHDKVTTSKTVTRVVEITLLCACAGERTSDLYTKARQARVFSPSPSLSELTLPCHALKRCMKRTMKHKVWWPDMLCQRQRRRRYVGAEPWQSCWAVLRLSLSREPRDC